MAYHLIKDHALTNISSVSFVFMRKKTYNVGPIVDRSAYTLITLHARLKKQ